MNEDINRIKTVLCEKRGLENGLRNSYKLTLRLFLNGVQIPLSLTYIRSGR